MLGVAASHSACRKSLNDNDFAGALDAVERAASIYEALPTEEKNKDKDKTVLSTTLELRVDALQGLGRPLDAAGVLMKLCSLHPKHAPYFVTAGQLLRKLQRLEDARGFFLYAAELSGSAKAKMMASSVDTDIRIQVERSKSGKPLQIPESVRDLEVLDIGMLRATHLSRPSRTATPQPPKAEVKEDEANTTDTSKHKRPTFSPANAPTLACCALLVGFAMVVSRLVPGVIACVLVLAAIAGLTRVVRLASDVQGIPVSTIFSLALVVAWVG